MRPLPPRQPPKCKRPILADLGLEVTIAIAACATFDQFIVTVSDRRITIDDYAIPAADDGALKGVKITDRWGCLFSADDIGPIPRLVWTAASLLEGKEDHLEYVRNAVSEAYQRQIHDEVVALHLSRYGIKSVQEFRDNGFKQFGEKIFGKLTEKIDSFDLGIDLLVFGFDPAGQPHIFQVENPGRPIDRDLITYWAIGSGANMALSALADRASHLEAEQPEVILYRLCEAKFSAETARAVGKTTSAMVMLNTGEIRIVSNQLIQKIRKSWEAKRREPPPSDVIAELSAGLKLKPRVVRAGQA